MGLPTRDDVREALLGKRQLAVFGEIDPGTDDYIADGLVMLNAASADPILLWIDSHGGQTLPALTIFDRIRISHAPVYGLVTYAAASSASLILQACVVRAALEHSRVHLHGVTYREVKLQYYLEEPDKFAEEGRRIQDFVFGVYTGRTKRTRDEIEALSKEEKPLFAEQALAFGLIDQIVHTREEFEALVAMPQKGDQR